MLCDIKELEYTIYFKLVVVFDASFGFLAAAISHTIAARCTVETKTQQHKKD